MTATEYAFSVLRQMDELNKQPSVFNPPREKLPRQNLRTDITVGMIAEDCALHIGEVVECDPESGDVKIKSMFDGVTRGCDLYHCGVYEVPPEEIAQKVALYNEGGMPALVKLYESSFE